MSDSDSDLSTSNMNEFTFQNNNTIYSVHGPNMNDITSYSRARQISNNHVSSTIEMPARLGRPMFTDINYDQRSLYSRSRRGASPMSVMSACDFNNFNQYRKGTIVNDRSRSPMSVRSFRSIDSNTKENARHIAMRIQSSQFCPKNLRIIIEAIKKSYSKKNRRNYIEKRRKRRYNINKILKLSKQDLTSDSGGQASDSSISSIEGSITTSTKENMSSCRSTKTDIVGSKRKLQVNSMFNDHTHNLKQNDFRGREDGSVDLNITSVSSQNMAQSSMLSPKTIPDHVKFNNKSHNSSNIMLLKDRFKSKFLLPSERFKKLSNSSSISEYSGITSNSRNNLQNILNHNNGMTQDINQTNGTKHNDSDADQYDIFSESISRQKNKNDTKRKDHEGYTSIYPNEKRAKVGVPSIVNNGNMESTSEESSNTNKNATTNDFVFAKPQLPVGKSTKERINNKSTSASKIHEESLITAPHVQNSEQSILMEHDASSDPSNVTQNTSDVSNRTSFIKRKLFSQKLDMTEKKTMPVDSSPSPHDVYSIQKEKHKARKLQQVTTQSCLSRDFEQDDTNLVDLIHKIVPLEQKNKTEQTKNKTAENNDKWDVTSIISLNNSTEDVSDTYTDEEVLNATVKQLANDNIPKKHTQTKITDSFKANTKEPEDNVLKNQTQPKTTDCRVVINTLPSVSSKLQQTNNGKSNESGYIDIKKCIQCFWDTDFESDIDSQPTRSKVKSKQKVFKGAEQNIFRGFPSKNTKDTTIQPIASASSMINNTSNNLQKFKYSTFSLRSYRQPTNKRYFEFGATDDTHIHDTNSKILNSSIETTNGTAKNNCQGNKTSETPQNKKKSPKNKGTTSKINKTIDSVKALTKAQTKKNVSQITDQIVKTSETKIEIKQKAPKRNNKKNNVQNNTNNLNTINNDATITKVDASKKSTKKVAKNIENAENINLKNKQVTKDHDVTKKTPFKNKKVLNKEKDSRKSKKVPNKQKQSANISILSKSMNSKKKNCLTLQQNTSVNDNSIIEERKNRSLRTCRIYKNLNLTNTTLNESFNMTLRSRRTDLTSSINGNSTSSKEKDDFKATKSRLCDKTNSKEKIDSKEAKSRVSDVSFSLPTKTCVSIVTRAMSKTLDSSQDLNLSNTFL